MATIIDPTMVRYRGIVPLLLCALMLGACGGRGVLPTVAEEAALIRQSGLGPTSRIAVVSNAGFGTRAVIDEEVAQGTVNAVADIASQLLGVEAVALDQSPSGPWQREMVESWDKAGFFEVIDHYEFFAQRDFDGYVIVMLESTGYGGFENGAYTRTEKRGSGNEYFNPLPMPELYESFSPQYRLYLRDEKSMQPLMRSGLGGRVDCQQRQVINAAGDNAYRVFDEPEQCAQEFAQQFEDYLSARVALTER